VRGDGAYAASPLDALADEAQLLTSGTSVAFSKLKCALPLHIVTCSPYPNPP
jgi:hypothetical protein